MTLIMPSRRRFLTLAAPAIVVAANLMPGHSIAKLLEPPMRKFVYVFNDPLASALDKILLYGYVREGERPVVLTERETESVRMLSPVPMAWLNIEHLS